MNTQVTLSLNEDVLHSAELFAQNKGLNLSQLSEILFRKLTYKYYKEIEDIPIADWVKEISEGPAEFVSDERSWKERKSEVYESKL